MTVRPNDKLAELARADAEAVRSHNRAIRDKWRDPDRRRQLFERAVRLRQDDAGLPDFQVIPDERDPAGLLVSSEELLVRREDLAGRSEALRRNGMVDVPIQALGGRVSRLVTQAGAPRCD